ncbi:uncharacterized protein LOC127007516 [Eriocheir sinensis]|uniref:uncharacterized protein LOC127007516 n=1 Tax=Eriocheir sinensis TaxID=95602 RepID=UPI0021C7D646|nr:uncharacterized protein LOC127007516 [Eriocheir sinensis]
MHPFPHHHLQPQQTLPSQAYPFARSILELINKGLVDRWIEQQLPNGTACLSPPGSDLQGTKRPLSLTDYYGLFFMYGVCVLAWSLVLGAEMLVVTVDSKWRVSLPGLLTRTTKTTSTTT